MTGTQSVLEHVYGFCTAYLHPIQHRPYMLVLFFVLDPKTENKLLSVLQALRNTISQPLNAILTVLSGIPLCGSPEVFNPIKFTMKSRVKNNNMTSSFYYLFQFGPPSPEAPLLRHQSACAAIMAVRAGFSGVFGAGSTIWGSFTFWT